LGNLIGLGRLLAFIANEAGFDVGSLTIQSTHACLDPDLQRGEVFELITAFADPAALTTTHDIHNAPQLASVR
jgi:hypothetical protein